MAGEQKIFEFRGVDQYHFAEVLQDDENGYVCGTPVSIPVQEVGKTVEASSESHYYDNAPLLIINAEGADTITLVLAPPALEELSRMIGRSFDPQTGMMIETPRQNRYYAIMYRTKGTDGHYRYVSRLKGQFATPDQTVQTENNTTDTENTTFTFTGIYTMHEFAKGTWDESTGQWVKSKAKSITVDDRYKLVDFTNFFAQIQTPDTVTPAGSVSVTGVSLAPSVVTINEIDANAQLVATVSPASATNKAVTYASSDPTVAEVSAAGLVTAKANGTTVITVTTTDGGFQDVCAVTVAAE